MPAAHVLVTDDNSPDGTGEIADGSPPSDDQVHVLHRLGKEGLGAAYLAGFAWGFEHGYDVLVEMDADGSHQPEQLPAAARRAEHADMVMGSRWVNGGRVVNWPKSREFLSRGGNLWTQLMLGVPLKDATGGFNVFRARDPARHRPQRDRIRRLLLPGRPVLACAEDRLPVVEVPITFVERERGDSKMSQKIVVEALIRTTLWGIKHRTQQLGRPARIRRAVSS